MPRDDSRPPPVARSPRRSSKYANDPVALGLRKLWQGVEEEPVPDEFMALLDAIDSAQSADAPENDGKPEGGKP